MINATLFGKGKCDGSVVRALAKYVSWQTTQWARGGARDSSVTVHSMQLFNKVHYMYKTARVLFLAVVIPPVELLIVAMQVLA